MADKKECQTWTTENNLNWENDGSWDAYPKGCNTDGVHYHWNDHPTGARHGELSQICKSVDQSICGKSQADFKSP